MGSANTTSTGFGERTHLVLKDCFQLTNRHSAEAIEEQVRTLLPCCTMFCLIELELAEV